MESAEFVDRFGRYVDARSATMFVGAGLSRALGYPDWPTLLESAREHLGIDPISDLPQLAQDYVSESKDGRSELVKQIEATFEVPPKLWRHQPRRSDAPREATTL